MEILLAGCISEPSFNTVRGPLITQDVHVQQLPVVFSSKHRKTYSITSVRQAAVAQGSSQPFADAFGKEWSTEVPQTPTVFASESIFRRNDGQGLCSWFAVVGHLGCMSSLPLTIVLRYCNSVPLDGTTGSKFGDRPLPAGNPVNSVCS